MDQDKFALVEKILKDIDNVMSKNAELYSFDIVPVESNFQNKSPVLHLENCLGLESWCVKHVYMYCYSEIMEKYLAKPKRKTFKHFSICSERLTKLLNVTLLLNPAVRTLWNKRREQVLRNLVDKSSELRFTKLVLSWKPKCNDAFSYREWLLDLILQGDNLQSLDLESLINEELMVCQLASDKCPNNYHSWSHRMWLINKLKVINKQSNIFSLYLKEYEFSNTWISKHVSDFSCFHYRQFSIKNLFSIDNNLSWKSLNDSININFRESLVRLMSSDFPKDVTMEVSKNDLGLCTEDVLLNMLFSHSYRTCNCYFNSFVFCRKLEILCYELNLTDELMRFYKSHETLWYHRRFIVHELLTLIYEYFGLIKNNGVLLKDVCRKCTHDSVLEKQTKLVKYDNNFIYSSNMFKILANHEKKKIDEMFSCGDNYALRHQKYLKFIQGISN